MRPPHLQKEILALLKDYPEGATARELCEATGKPIGNVAKAIKILVEKKKELEQHGLKNNARVWKLASQKPITLPKPPVRRDYMGKAFGRVSRHLGELIRAWGR